MKTTITTCIDVELKEKVMPIIQNEMNTSLAKVISIALEKIVKNNEEEKEVKNATTN